ncbi:MAG: Crp/Fnr family transcriptional regulator [Gammaproteobacteria bacterium]|nr:Crp/Fnr family transcriptional regulator [Gammaproteobacteria bacterium]
MTDSHQTTGAHTNFLSQLQDSDRNELYRVGRNRIYAKNDFIFTAGETDFTVFVLKHGRVKLFVSSAEGRDVLLWFSLAGEIFGLAECVQSIPRLVSAYAVEPCEVLCVAHAQFTAWLATKPEITFSLMKIMAERMRELGQRFLSLASGNIQMEVAQLLLRLGATRGMVIGEYIRIGIPLTEQDIADMVGSRRQGVSTCLAEMKRREVVDIDRRYIIIKKPEDLHQIANGTSSIVMFNRRMTNDRRATKLRKNAVRVCSEP